jgi:hypothetical protein
MGGFGKYLKKNKKKRKGTGAKIREEKERYEKDDFGQEDKDENVISLANIPG